MRVHLGDFVARRPARDVVYRGRYQIGLLHFRWIPPSGSGRFSRRLSVLLLTHLASHSLLLQPIGRHCYLIFRLSTFPVIPSLSFSPSDP